MELTQSVDTLRRRSKRRVGRVADQGANRIHGLKKLVVSTTLDALGPGTKYSRSPPRRQGRRL
jgi:hypothetical protein